MMVSGSIGANRPRAFFCSNAEIDSIAAMSPAAPSVPIDPAMS